MSILDDPRTYAKLDPSGLGALIGALPQQARDAWTLGQTWPALRSLNRPQRVIVVGVGGSAIGADVVADIVRSRSAVPIEVLRGYELPQAGAETIVVACSFSGSTEEVLEVFSASLERGHVSMALTTGGRLAELARAANAPLLQYSWDGPPRTAFGYGLFPLLAILLRLDVVDVTDAELKASHAALEQVTEQYSSAVPAASNPAKQLAEQIADGAAIVIGPGFLETAARRWAADLNENAKQFATYAALPEVDHNLIEGLLNAGSETALTAVLLDSPLLHRRNRTRVRVTARMLQATGTRPHVQTIEGDSLLEASVRAFAIGDWVSYYVAMLRGVDPAQTQGLDHVKATMADTSEDAP